MADGSYRSIEDVKIGDIVRTFDEPTRQFTESAVIETFHHEQAQNTLIEFELDNGRKLVSTPTHLILTGSGSQYLTAFQIFMAHTSGKAVHLSSEVNGSPVHITQASVFNRSQPVFNLHVHSPYDTLPMDANRGHNYIAEGVIVHNCKGPSDTSYADAAQACSDMGGIVTTSSSTCSPPVGRLTCTAP